MHVANSGAQQSDSPPAPCPRTIAHSGVAFMIELHATIAVREKEIGDERAFCSTSWGHVRIVPAQWSRRREADLRRQGTRRKLAGLGQDGVRAGARHDGR